MYHTPPDRELEGVNLKVGGEGMKGFYDDILPRFLNKYTKQWGAHVADLTLAGPLYDTTSQQRGPGMEPVHAIDVTPQMKDAVVTRGQPQFARRRDPVERIRRQAVQQDCDLQRAYDTLPQRQVGDQTIPVYDTGQRLKRNELSRLLQNPAVQDLATAVVDITRRVLDRLIGPAHPGIKGIGLLFDDDAYGVFFPHPQAREQQAVILINLLEYLRQAPRTPQEAADHLYATIVHEATHWHTKGEGPNFENAYAMNLWTLGAEANRAARQQLKEVYADPHRPDTLRPDLAGALSIYAASRRRRAAAPDPLSRAGRYETRPTDRGDESAEPSGGVRRDRGGTAPGRTVTRAELQALADKKDTTVAVQQARAEQAGYQVVDEPSAPSGGGTEGMAGTVITTAPGRPGRRVGGATAGGVNEPIEFPELVDLARELQGHARGRQSVPEQRTRDVSWRGWHPLRADLFKAENVQQFAATLAHEIGHLVDWLPHQTLKRGNLLGRLFSLRNLPEGTFSTADGTTVGTKRSARN